MKLGEWSAMTADQQQIFVQSIYDIHLLENHIRYFQLLLGMWHIIDRLSQDDNDARELRELIPLEQIEFAVELYSARYNQLKEVGPN